VSGSGDADELAGYAGLPQPGVQHLALLDRHGVVRVAVQDQERWSRWRDVGKRARPARQRGRTATEHRGHDVARRVEIENFDVVQAVPLDHAAEGARKAGDAEVALQCRVGVGRERGQGG
jgi:hypothetical protein